MATAPTEREVNRHLALRDYLEIIISRLWVVTIVFAVGVVASVVSVLAVPQATTPYQAVIKVSVLPQAEPRSDRYYTYDEYYAYIASEFLNDDLMDFIESASFARKVREWLASDGRPAAEGSFRAKKTHRVLTITATSPTAAGATNLAMAAAKLLVDPTKGPELFSLISRQNPTVTILEEPTIVAGPVGGRLWLDLGLRVSLALVVALALAFLLYGLDDSVRTPAEARESLADLAVLAEVPRSPGRRR